MGVWIEIADVSADCAETLSLPAWECGLKYDQKFIVICRRVVTPCVGVWIEMIFFDAQFIRDKSLPAWECGLKYLLSFCGIIDIESLPAWECGLK